jgi:hypothetical protein
MYFHFLMNYLVCNREHEDAVGSALELLLYCQLPDKNSRRISRDIWNFSPYFKFLFSLRFIVEPLTIFCESLGGKHSS